MKANCLQPTTKDAYRLLHQGSLVLSRMEHNGLKIDVPYLDRAVEDITGRIKAVYAQMKGDGVWRLWKRRFGERTNVGSREQLAAVLAGDMGVRPSKELTETGRARVDEKSLEVIDHPFVRAFIQVEKLKKALGTYLLGIRHELVGDYIHPVMNLHVNISYRSSISMPNVQNVPVRNKVMAEIVRRCYVPRFDYLCEVDLSGAEVKAGACYHKDPAMLRYITDPSGTDMHRDTSVDLFFLTPEEAAHPDMKKSTRDWAKNRFVFPQFYGAVYFKCAPDIWKAVRRNKDVRIAGTDETVIDRLRGNGVKRLGRFDPERDREPGAGTFYRHLLDVQTKLWRRFAGYDRWKRDFYAAYQRDCGYDLLSGFRVEGIYKRNDVVNYPIQGFAFHWLLYALVRLQRFIDRNRMRTLLVNEIHDSVIADCPADEVHDFLSEARRVMTEEVPRHWPSIIVPVECEAEVTSTNWNEKEQWVESKGVWAPKRKAA